VNRASDATHSATADARASKPTLAPAGDGRSDSGEVRYLRPHDGSRHSSPTMQPARAVRAPAAGPLASDRRRLERDLHTASRTSWWR
jgi:hypothetical protein